MTSSNDDLSQSKMATHSRQPVGKLWVVWLLFLFQYLAVGAYFIFLNVYWRQAGLTGTQIGTLNTTTSIIGVIGSIVWGYLSDKTGKPRLLIAIGAVGSLTIAQFIPLVHTFGAFFALTVLGSSLSSSLTTLVDGVTLALLGARSENYGRFRLGGSIGYILAASISGFIYDKTGLGLIFPVYGVIMGSFAAIALLLPNIPVKFEQRAKAQLGRMIRQPAWVIFMVSVFLTWIGNYASILYLGVTLLSMGASQSIIGLSSTSAALIEIPFMAFSGWFIRKVGLVRLIILAIFLMMTRFVLLGLMPDPGWAFFINILNGPAYGLFATCIVAYAKAMAPSTLTVTAQGLLNSTIGLAGVVSAMLTGVLFDLIGPKNIFFVMAAFSLVAIISFSLGALRWKISTDANNLSDEITDSDHIPEPDL